MCSGQRYVQVERDRGLPVLLRAHLKAVGRRDHVRAAGARRHVDVHRDQSAAMAIADGGRAIGDPVLQVEGCRGRETRLLTTLGWAPGVTLWGGGGGHTRVSLVARRAPPALLRPQ